MTLVLQFAHRLMMTSVCVLGLKAGTPNCNIWSLTQSGCTAWPFTQLGLQMCCVRGLPSAEICRPYQDSSVQENLPEWSKNSLESSNTIPGMTLKTWRGNLEPEYWMSPWFGQLHWMPHPCFSDKCLKRYLMLEGCHRTGEKQGWFYLCLIRDFMRIKSDNV